MKRVCLSLLFIMLTGPAMAGCIYICENGFSCMMTCDGMGVMTVPDPASNNIRWLPSTQEESSSDSYDYSDKGRVQKIYPNEYVNDLPNTEEPDVFTMDIKSLEKPELKVVVCEYSDYSEEYGCRDL